MNDPIGTAWQVFVSHDRQVQAPPHLESRIMAATAHRPEPAAATGVVAFAFALAAAIAVALADRGFPVRLSTTDPAAHVAVTVGGTLPHLTVSRIDPKAETDAYAAEVMASAGKDLDARGKAMLEEDLRSPCTEEFAGLYEFKDQGMWSGNMRVRRTF